MNIRRLYVEPLGQQANQMIAELLGGAGEEVCIRVRNTDRSVYEINRFECERILASQHRDSVRIYTSDIDSDDVRLVHPRQRLES